MKNFFYIFAILLFAGFSAKAQALLGVSSFGVREIPQSLKNIDKVDSVIYYVVNKGNSSFVGTLYTKYKLHDTLYKSIDSVIIDNAKPLAAGDSIKVNFTLEFKLPPVKKSYIIVVWPTGTGGAKTVDSAKRTINIDQIVGINDELPLKTHVRFYPNPTEDILHFDLEDGFSIKSLTITDVDGKKINNITKPINNQIDFSNQPSGIYFILLQYNNNETGTFKILKQ